MSSTGNRLTGCKFQHVVNLYSRHFRWSSEPREGLPVCRAKEVPSFLSCFETLCTWSGARNRIRDLPLCSHAFYRLS